VTRMPYPRTDAVLEAETAHTQAALDHARTVADLTAVRDAVQAGRDVEPAELTEAAAKAEHAELRVEAAHRKLAETRFNARKRALLQIAMEITEYDGDPDLARTFIDDLKAIETAINALVGHVLDHDRRVADWQKRAGEMLAFGNQAQWQPPADQGGVAVNSGFGYSNIQSGDLLLQQVDVTRVLTSLGAALHLAADHDPRIDLAELTVAVVGDVRRVSSNMRVASTVTPAHFRNKD
jgi:hypothetical protein